MLHLRRYVFIESSIRSEVTAHGSCIWKMCKTDWRTRLSNNNSQMHWILSQNWNGMRKVCHFKGFLGFRFSAIPTNRREDGEVKWINSIRKMQMHLSEIIILKFRFAIRQLFYLRAKLDEIWKVCSNTRLGLWEEMVFRFHLASRARNENLKSDWNWIREMNRQKIRNKIAI